MIGFDFTFNVAQPVNFSEKSKKFILIADGLSFQNAISVSNLLIYNNTKRPYQIMANPNQYDFKILQFFNWDEKDPQLFKIIADSANCFIEPTYNPVATIRMVTTPSVGLPSTLELISKKINIQMEDKAFENITGLGLRLFANNPEGKAYNEFKIEPLLSDKTKLYFEAFYHFDNFVKCTESEVTRICESAYTDYKAKVDSAIANLTK